MFNMGRGMFNMETSQARSINVDTRMRWNAAVWQGQMVKNRLYQARVKAGQERAIKLSKEIQDRLRNHPETRDITDGDALNVLLDSPAQPGGGRSLAPVHQDPSSTRGHRQHPI